MSQAAKTVEARAAELGASKRELVRALKALCRYNLKTGKPVKRDSGYGIWTYWPKESLMSTEQAAAMLGVDVTDAEREIKLSYPTPWSVKRVVDGLFEFMKKEGRFPMDKDLRNKNGLPSPSVFRWFAWNTQSRTSDAFVSPRDWWERQIAADRRCTPEMAFALRNVLARKEAIDRIGFQNLIKKGFATVVDEDVEFGILYRMPGETPTESMLMLKVVNSTPEPDGTFADYYLRVPPEMTNVRDALKWTFNGRDALANLEYAPLVET